MKNQSSLKTIQLPPPALDGKFSVEAAIAARRTRRQFAARPLSWAQIGQLLWAAGGVTDPAGDKRAAPSAGARYPLEFYVVVAGGLYRYQPADHSLLLLDGGDALARLRGAVWQDSIATAPCTIGISAVFSRTTERYGERGRDRYVAMDVGHAAGNFLLQATALGLASCPVGAFDDGQVAAALQLSAEETPLYLLPVGWEVR